MHLSLQPRHLCSCLLDLIQTMICSHYQHIVIIIWHYQFQDKHYESIHRFTANNLTYNHLEEGRLTEGGVALYV